VLAGDNTRDFVLGHLFFVGNAMVLKYDACSKFDELLWAIDAVVPSDAKVSLED
jgi:hypothetical protein